MAKRVRCLYCHRLFYPDPRCKHPKSCKRPECQKRRKNDAHKRWRDSDLEVIEDRRKVSKEWRRDHPGYMRDYRARHPGYVERNRRLQRGKGIGRRVVKSISISPQVIDKYYEFTRSLSVVKSISIANRGYNGVSGMP